MTDVVYLVRDGENPELRYSLRTLVNVDHGLVWIFGGAPWWVNPNEAFLIHRAQGISAHQSTQQHMKAACLDREVSDPFTVWNDDFYAMRYVGEIPVMNRGPLERLVEEFARLRTTWAHSLREVRAWAGPNTLSFDNHVPLVIHKEPMLEALKVVSSFTHPAAHLRTVYGKIAEITSGSITMPDPKMRRRTDPFPDGPWLSSGDSTFRGCVEPVLRYLFPNPGKYEV